MTVSEAIAKMQATVEGSKAKLEGNGFVMSVETDYMNGSFKTVQDVKKAKFVTVSLVIGAAGTDEGEEYCMSLGADIRSKNVNEKQLEEDIAHYLKMVDDAAEVLEGYEDKLEGLNVLTKKASEEFEKLVAKIEEEQKKSRRISMIGNIVFIIGIALLFIIAFLR